MRSLYHGREQITITKQAYAIYKYPKNGSKKDQEKTRTMKLNEKFEVIDIDVGSKSTMVMIKNEWYNSVQFDFCDKKGNPVDIYMDAQFNPYLQYKMSL